MAGRGKEREKNEKCKRGFRSVKLNDVEGNKSGMKRENVTWRGGKLKSLQAEDWRTKVVTSDRKIKEREDKDVTWRERKSNNRRKENNWQRNIRDGGRKLKGKKDEVKQ